MRSIFAIVIVSSTFLGLFGSDCRAQSTSRFQLSNGTPLPQSAPLAKNCDGETFMVWVAEEGYRPRYSYQDSATKVPRELKFMEPLWLVEAHKDPRTGREYLLLAKADPGGRQVTVPYGWVNGEVCVRSQGALKNAGTHIYRNALLVNRMESLKSSIEGDSSDLLQGAFRAGPSDRAGFRTDVFCLHNLLFVYAETEQHYLLGVAANFGADPTRVVKGWVSKNRVSRWDTRIALEWDVASAVSADRSERGVVWDSQESAQAWHDGRTVPDSAKLFVEAVGPVDVFELSKWPTLPQGIMPRTVVMRSRYEPTKLVVRGIRHYDDKAVPKPAPLGTVRRASLPLAWHIPRMPMLQKTKKDPRTDNILYKIGWFRGPPFDEVDERLKRAGEAGELLGFEGAQVYDEGYVWRYARTSGGWGAAQQVRPMVLLRYDAIADIVRILKALVGERPAGVAEKSFKDLYEAEVERLLGQEDDPNSELTISDVFFMKLGLPANSPLLRRSPTELDKVGIGETELEILKLKLKLLEDILHPEGGIRRDWRIRSVRHEAGHMTRRPVYTSAVREERFFTFPGDPYEDRWCWIDLEEEWP